MPVERLVPREEISRKLREWLAVPENQEKLKRDKKAANDFIEEFRRRTTRIRKY